MRNNRLIKKFLKEMKLFFFNSNINKNVIKNPLNIKKSRTPIVPNPNDSNEKKSGSVRFFTFVE